MRGTEDAAGKHYLRNRMNEVAELPHWLWLMVENKSHLSLRWGPYAFYNNFEETAEAQYLIEMFKHRVLTATAESKVKDIMKKYEPLIHINDTFVQALIEREGCPDYWSSDKSGQVINNETYRKIQERFGNDSKN